jgi:hypothetical protein
MIGFDRNRSDLFRCNPVRNPLVRNPMKFGSVPTDFYMEFAGFRSNPISDSIVSGRIYRLDWITWVCYKKNNSFLFRTSGVFSYEHRSFFVPNIRHFMFWTSYIFRCEHLDDFHSEHPVFFMPIFRIFHSEHPDFFKETGVRNGLLRPISVKKSGDEKGLPLKNMILT